MSGLEDLDALMDALSSPATRSPAQDQNRVVDPHRVPPRPAKKLDITGITNLGPNATSYFRMWESESPWIPEAGTKPILYDNFMNLEPQEPVAVLTPEVAITMPALSGGFISPSQTASSLTPASAVRFWREPSARRLQQCIVSITSDANLRNDQRIKGVLWLPVLNHRAGGEVKGLVVHRALYPLENEMRLSEAACEIQMTDPKGAQRGVIAVEAQSLLTPFSFSLDGHARSGTWKLKLTSGGQLLDSLEFEVLSFSKPDIEVTALDGISPIALGSGNFPLRFRCKYFFDELVSRASVSWSLQPSDPKQAPLRGTQVDCRSNDGTFSFPAIVSKPGTYRWEVTVTDKQHRTGSLSGAYTVVEPSYGLICAVKVTSQKVLPQGASTVARVFPGISIVELEVALADQNGTRAPNVPFTFSMEGRGEFWDFVEEQPATTGAAGTAMLRLKFKEAAFDTEEPFLLLVNLEHEGKRYVSRKTILVDPVNQYSLTYDKESYSPGEKVNVAIRYKGPEVGAVLACDLVGTVIWYATTVRLDSQGAAQVSFDAPDTCAPLFLHVRPSLKAAEARFAVPLRVSPFVSDALAVTGSTRVCTGEAIKVRAQLPEKATKAGKAVAWLVDRRIKKHPRHNDLQHWQSTFKVDPYLKSISKHSFVDLEEWEYVREAVQFEAMLCSHNWVGFAFLNPSKRGRVLLVNAPDLAVFSPAVRRQFLLTHLSPTLSASDATASLAQFPTLAEAHVFSVGETSKSLRHLSSWARSGSPVDSRSIRKALKGQISFLTNNLIVTPPKRGYRDLKKKKMLMDALDNLRSAMRNLIDAAKACREEDYYQEVVHRQHFLEVAFVEVQFAEGATYVDLEFPKGSDAVTTYDIFVFACTPHQIALGQHQCVVKNRYFTITKNPPQMVLGDRSVLRTIVQNTSEKAMEDLSLRLRLELLQCDIAEQRIARVEPNGAEVVSWPVVASGVGDAAMELVMTASNGFTEISHLDTPLRIVPPGEPAITRENALIDAEAAAKFTVSLSGSEAHTDIFLSILPFLPSAGAIEGVESLAKYPYGCCEQTHSSTKPNYILYKYLESQPASPATDALKAKLKEHMAVGAARLISQYKGPSGGYGCWSREPTTFHTALILSLFGLMKEIIPIEQRHLDDAVKCLEQMMSSDGSFTHSTSFYPETQLSTVGLTAHVFHSMALAGSPHAKTLQWLKANLLAHTADATAVALVLAGLTHLPAALRAKYWLFMRNLRLVLLTDQSSDGSWESSSTTLCGNIEATSYSLIALAHMSQLESAGPPSRETLKALQAGLDYLMANRRAGGWTSTRDTLYASWAIGEAGKIVWPPTFDSAYEVSVNGKQAKKFELRYKSDAVSTDLVYKMREVHLDGLKAGENEIIVSATGHRAAVMLELQRFFFPREDADEATDSGAGTIQATSIGRLTAAWDATSFEKGTPARLSVQFQPHDDYGGLMLEIPVPAGLVLPSLDKVVCDQGNVMKEFNEKLKKICIFFHRAAATNVSVTFDSLIPGNVLCNPCRAFLMYAPDYASLTGCTQLQITGQA